MKKRNIDRETQHFFIIHFNDCSKPIQSDILISIKMMLDITVLKNAFIINVILVNFFIYLSHANFKLKYMQISVQKQCTVLWSNRSQCSNNVYIIAETHHSR